MSKYIMEIYIRSLESERDRSASILEDSRKWEEYYCQECFKRGARIRELENQLDAMARCER